MKHLKDKSYYEDFYDKHTVEDCRLTERSSKKVRDEDVTSRGLDVTKSYKIDSLYKGLTDIITYFKAGDRYLNKEATITEWMDKDSQRDGLYDKPEPMTFCPKCSKQMEMIYKYVRENFKTSEMRVLYLYRCDACNEKKGMYDNGEPYVFQTSLCPKCKKELDIKNKKTKNKIITRSTCSNCGYEKKDEIDLEEKPKAEEVDPDFEKDKERFCLSREKGEDYRSWKANLESLSSHFKDIEEHKKEHEEAQRTKILTIAQLSEILNKRLTKEGYGSLSILAPEIGRDLIVSFNVQDTKVDRSEYDSKRILKKIIEELLAGTNWRLMSDGIKYQLGVLQGRLRGQDSQEHIFEDLKNI